MKNSEIVKRYIWYLYNQFSLPELMQFYGKIVVDDYVLEKWEKVKTDPNKWFMDLDQNNRDRFIDIAVEYYEKD